MKKLFILFDGRAKDGDTDSASVYACAYSEQEALEDAKDYEDYDAIWYEYGVEEDSTGAVNDKLVNGKARWDMPPATHNQ